MGGLARPGKYVYENHKDEKTWLFPLEVRITDSPSSQLSYTVFGHTFKQMDIRKKARILGGISSEAPMMTQPQCGVNFQIVKLLWLKENKISSQLGTMLLETPGDFL